MTDLFFKCCTRKGKSTRPSYFVRVGKSEQNLFKILLKICGMNKFAECSRFPYSIAPTTSQNKWLVYSSIVLLFTPVVLRTFWCIYKATKKNDIFIATRSAALSLKIDKQVIHGNSLQIFHWIRPHVSMQRTIYDQDKTRK